ncbi:hypothetical protein KEM52_003698 [Ascosphaera acerosa]|nr:hypothetical protein KEM52_003698 [Ascosphaera acerosa]
MLLLHQTGSLRVGEVVRYTLTYSPSKLHLLPTPQQVHVRIRNTAAVPLRAAYLHGPYTLYVSCHPAEFDPGRKTEYCGIPQFEPNLRAGGSWDALVSLRANPTGCASRALDDVTWIIEVASQILFSTSAEVPYEICVGTDEKALELGTTGKSGVPPGDLKDHVTRPAGVPNVNGRAVKVVAGVFSPAISLEVQDTDALWNTGRFPSYQEKLAALTGGQDQPDVRTDGAASAPPSEKDEIPPRDIHLVVLTHGLHSNVGADMLYLKESIEKATRRPRAGPPQDKRQTRQTSSQGQPSSHARTQSRTESDAPCDKSQSGHRASESPPVSENGDGETCSSEEVVVCGFPGNVVRTERGIQYLAKRLAKYVLLMTYPDQPYLPQKIPSTRHGLQFSKNTPQVNPHEVRPRFEALQRKYAYRIRKISFVGHSLGGLIQTSALAYIHEHSPDFFDLIQPVNFIALASPFLGLSHENPIYVRFALDFGLVGRTGQDLGLAWRPPKVKSGWEAMIGGLSSDNAHSTSSEHVEASSKPLLRILPTGPAHEVLQKFERRTIYANVVNDGIVPLRTSSLLFLDWRGLQRVTKARRENGPVGAMAEWGWAELTGSTATASRQRLVSETHAQAVEVRRSSEPSQHSVSAAAASFASRDESTVLFDSSTARATGDASANWTKTLSPINTLLAFFRSQKTHPHSKKAAKIFNRTQTLPPTVTAEVAKPSFANEQHPHSAASLVEQAAEAAGLQDGEPTHHHSESAPCLPPKTTLLEAAGDVLNPPLPSDDFIMNPATRPRTIFHDRVYHPDDIPPPPPAKARTFFGTSKSHSTSSNSSTPGLRDDKHESSDQHSSGNQPVKKPSGMEVEEKIARAYHAGLSWRKVLVRLEPDAHNNMLVRRMFANAYGWPVIAHLVENHFQPPAATPAVQPTSEASAGQETGPSEVPLEMSEEMASSELLPSTHAAFASPRRRMTDPGVLGNSRPSHALAVECAIEERVEAHTSTQFTEDIAPHTEPDGGGVPPSAGDTSSATPPGPQQTPIPTHS